MTVEFWRFAFTALVCLFHLEIYFMKRGVLPSGSSAVEFFFILAGFTMAMSAKRNLAGRTVPLSVKEAQAYALDFVKKKLKAIYPVIVAVMILWIVVTPVMQGTTKLEMLQNTEWEFLLMVGTPFGYMDGMAPIVPMWFLTALLLAGYIYTFLIYKNYDLVKFLAPVGGILLYTFFALNADTTLDFFIPMGFLNAGMIRALAEMSFGVSIFYLYEYLSKKNLGTIWVVILSLLEVYSIYRFITLTFWQPVGLDNYRRIPYILIIVLLAFLNVTLLSRALSKLGKLWKLAGSITLTMYLCHLPMVNVYLSLLNGLKMKLMPLARQPGFAKGLYQFLDGTGGVSAGFKPSYLSWKDAVLFIPLVVITAIVITLIIAAIKRYAVPPLVAAYRKKQAERKTAEIAAD